MTIILNPDIYEKAKQIVYKRYKKASAYRSGALVKLYKEMGGSYKNDSKGKPLDRWFKEKWTDVNPYKTKSSYPVYRPTIRVNSKTPLTLYEISKSNLKKQALIKQKIKGKKNLKPFKKSKKKSSKKSSKKM